MYQHGVLAATASTTGTAAATGILPFTGLNLVWFVIAAFALLMAAGALWRIAPRRLA